METSDDNIDFCALQIARLMNKPYARSANPIAIAELGDVLCKYAESQDHARSIIDKIVESDSEWPDTSDLIALARTSRTMQIAPDPDCPKCGRSGFQSFDKIIDGVKYPYAKRCSCWALRLVVQTAEIEENI